MIELLAKVSETVLVQLQSSEIYSDMVPSDTPESKEVDIAEYHCWAEV